jgi:hypothetical protein
MSDTWPPVVGSVRGPTYQLGTSAARRGGWAAGVTLLGGGDHVTPRVIHGDGLRTSGGGDVSKKKSTKKGDKKNKKKKKK